MLIRQIMEMFDLLDRCDASGSLVAQYMRELGGALEINTVTGEEGSTDFVRLLVKGKNGKSGGGSAPTLGILGRLGGLGARPERIGFVSDGDGALAALAAGAKLLDMQRKGDVLEGDIIVSTHICPDAPTSPHKPVPFMGSPVSMQQCNEAEMDPGMDAVLSIDTTKGNRIINTRGFAISPTVKKGYILPVSDDLLDLMQQTTGKLPCVFALSTQDITPYGNDLYHLNSILQPATATDAPVVGVAITAEVPVAGCATGASHFGDIESAARFAVEVAKAYGRGECSFYDEKAFAHLESLYGTMDHLKTMGRA